MDTYVPRHVGMYRDAGIGSIWHLVWMAWVSQRIVIGRYWGQLGNIRWSVHDQRRCKGEWNTGTYR